MDGSDNEGHKSQTTQDLEKFRDALAEKLKERPAHEREELQKETEHDRQRSGQ